MHRIPTAPRRAATSLSVVLVALLALTALPAFGSPEARSADATGDGRPFVTLGTADVSPSTQERFSYTANIVIDQPTSYLESRLQIRNPGGRLIFQKTEVRNQVATGTVEIAYERALDDLGLSPGAYPVELRVRSDASGLVREWVVDDTLFLHDPDREPVPLALIVRIGAVPSYDPGGRFVHEPGGDETAREQADALARLVLADPDLRLSLALSPALAEEWARIASGYEVVGPSGVREVPAEEPVPQAYAETLALLREALETGRLELLAVGYADPDVSGLQSAGRIKDLGIHYERGLSALLASLETSAGSGAMLADGLLPAEAAPVIAARGIDYAVISTGTVEADQGPHSGHYAITDAASSPIPLMQALVIDHDLSRAFSSASSTRTLEIAFDRHVSDESTAPLVALAEVGPGLDTSVQDIVECVTGIGDMPWIDPSTCADVAREEPEGRLVLKEVPRSGTRPPGSYWDEVGAARALATAFLHSAGVNDPDAQAANDDSLIAQSRAWAGPDDRWASSDRGLSFAASAARAADSVLDGISVSAQDIVLSSSQGEVPFSLNNASEKNLLLTVSVRGRGIALPAGETVTLTARPQDNYFTVPVDLQSALSGTLEVRVSAGDVVLDEATVTVRATVLDRLALVGAVSLVLVGLLLFIRHRARSVDAADTMDAR